MLRNKIGWQIFLTCYLITAFALWFSTWYSAHIYKENYYKSVTQIVTVQSQLLARDFVKAITEQKSVSYIDSLSNMLGNIAGTRLTIILPDGKVIGDSKVDPDTMENHKDRLEISQAMQGKPEREIRYSTTLKENMLYYAAPLFDNDQICGVLRVAVPLGEINKHVRGFYNQLIIVSVILFLLLGFLTFLFINMLSKPIGEMKVGAHNFAKGDFSRKLKIPKSEELGELARALNGMAVSLDERIQIITQQRNELDAILVSLDEGVIAVDNNEKIISINPAARSIFNIEHDSVNGSLIHGVVRNSDLQKFIASTMSSNKRVEALFTLPSPAGEQMIQAYGTLLLDYNSNPKGAVLVFNDITRIRTLENVRKEFVANVSHELRTPLTSIKGFVETIRCGNYALPDDVSKFLEIISSRTNNLCSIIDDILTLSSIERDSEHREIHLTLSPLNIVLQDAVNTCRWKADKKDITINLDCLSDIKVCINSSLIEHAIVNLLDNAIKYSNNKTEINIAVESRENELIIFVIDHGCGIAEVHHQRIFERFYRVDKARSRKLGGTGLGLSIVKNIINAHEGNVIVKSTVGSGSTFEIRLPVNNILKEIA